MPVTVGTKHRDPSINVSGPRIVVHDPAAATDRPSRIKAPWAHQQFPRSHYLLACLRGYCAYRLQISGTGRQGYPYLRPPCRGPRPYTISVVNSFRCSFIWVLWLARQVRSVVAATPLANSDGKCSRTQSDFIFICRSRRNAAGFSPYSRLNHLLKCGRSAKPHSRAISVALL